MERSLSEVGTPPTHDSDTPQGMVYIQNSNMRLVERAYNMGGWWKRDWSKIKLVSYVIPFGSILITVWTPNLHNVYIVDSSSYMNDIDDK